jgi:predicted dehydrogenase
MALNRRSFIKSTAVGATALAMPASSYAKIIGANEGIRIGVIGLRGRGQNHMSGLKKHVVALCDCDEKILNDRAKGLEVQKFVDFRELLENKDIDAVSIATPNHTHSLIGIMAMQSGKDVYVEKPVSHNVWEGRQLAEAARKYDKICQCGTQSRSSPSLQNAVQFVRDGELGKIQYALGTCFKPRQSIGKLTKPLQIPPHINYDLWCGPAEKQALYRPNLHYDWHWDFNTGNGDMGNQGIHQMDIARWFLGGDELSPRILSIGGRLGYDDAGNTPNTQTVLHDYPGAPLIFETRGLPKSQEFQTSDWGKNMDRFRGSGIGVIVQCENGHVLIPSYSAAQAMDGDGKVIKKWQGGGNHYRNFVEAVNSRDRSKLNGEIMEGHLSSALCHTGGVSHQLGKPARYDEIKEQIGDHELFLASFERIAKHLEANGIDIRQSASLTLGADLKMDGKKETFTNNEKARQMLSRPYRKGFEVAKIT